MHSEFEKIEHLISKPKIIIVDDDAGFRAPINAILSSEGIVVKEASTAVEMDSLLNNFQADMILLDVCLPGENGLSIAKRLKTQRPIDIVMLSALGDVKNRVEGLRSGADYYLSKPIDMTELLAVIQTRFMSHGVNDVKQEDKWILNTKKWLFTAPDGQINPLNSSELVILNLLAEQSRLGKPTTKKALSEALGKTHSTRSRSVDLHISRIRKRFSYNGLQFPIKTLRNIGYELTEEITVL